MEQLQPFAFTNLGAKEKPRDDRDWKAESFLLPVPKDIASLIPQIVNNILVPPDALLGTTIYMQNKRPACGAHMAAGIVNTLTKAITSPQYIWDQIKQIDFIPPTDGTDIRSVFKALKNSGACLLTLLPNNSELSDQDYANIVNVTPEMIADAQVRRITNYAFISNPTFEQIQAAIAQYKSVALRVACGDGWYTDANGNISWQEKDVLPLHLGKYVSGHFIEAKATDGIRIWGPNSWSEQWGRNGFYYFDRSYLQNVFEMGIPLTLNASQFIFHTDLYIGLQLDDVKQLQIRLGLPVQYQTGFFGLITEGAVKQYQTEHNIPHTGYVGPLTRAALNNGL